MVFLHKPVLVSKKASNKWYGKAKPSTVTPSYASNGWNELSLIGEGKKKTSCVFLSLEFRLKESDMEMLTKLGLSLGFTVCA